MKGPLIFAISGILAAMFLTACATQYSYNDMSFGTSYKLAKFGQIANPDAEKNLSPVTGLEGQAAEAVIGKYRKGFGAASQSSGHASGSGYGAVVPLLPIASESMPGSVGVK